MCRKPIANCSNDGPTHNFLALALLSSQIMVLAPDTDSTKSCSEDGVALHCLGDKQANEAQHGCAAKHHLCIRREGGDAERPLLATLPRYALQMRRSQSTDRSTPHAFCQQEDLHSVARSYFS